MEARSQSVKELQDDVLIAVKTGYLKRVKKLLDHPDVDINFHYCQLIYDEQKFQITLESRNQFFFDNNSAFSLLSAAIRYNEMDIAEYLIKKGGKVENDKYGYILPSIVSKTILGLLCYFPSTPRVYNLILRKTFDLGSEVVGSNYVSSKKIPWILFFDKKSQIHDRLNKLNFFICEVMLRNDRNLLDFIKNEIMFTPDYVIDTPLNLNNLNWFLKEYLEDRMITSQEQENAIIAIEYMEQIGLINHDKRRDLTRVIQNTWHVQDKINRHPSLISFDDLPQELKKIWIPLPNRHRLSELFSEFQSHVYPEIGLPSISVNNPMFDESNYRLSRTEIIKWQNPLNLRAFLELDEYEVIKRLGFCFNIKGENPAALLLAQIVIFKGNEKVEDETKGKPTPYLSSKQQKNCLYFLRRIYSLPREKLLDFSVHKDQNFVLNLLKGQNEKLTEQVDELTEQVKELRGQNSLIEKKLEEITNILKNSMNHSVGHHGISNAKTPELGLFRRNSTI